MEMQFNIKQVVDDTIKHQHVIAALPQEVITKILDILQNPPTASKNGQPFPLSVEVVGCTEPPCDVVKGTTAVMYVNFAGTKDVTRNLKAKVRATTLGITVPYELPEDVADVCSNLMHGATCPIYKSEDVTYEFNFHIDSSYPEIAVAVEVSLNDENNESAACFICNIKVKKGATKPLMLE